MEAWRRIIGCDPEEFCDRLYASRPDWVKGTVSASDARFLFRRALEARAEVMVEIGTASGFSSVFLCHALRFASAAGLIGPDFRLVSYDLHEEYYVDPTRRTGEVAQELLEPALLEHVTFRSPASSLDVGEDFAGDPLTVMFLDANHSHPWPALDLLATLDALRAGAEVILHDINLPVKHPDISVWGVKHLFDRLDVEKVHHPDDPLPNIGSIRIPTDREEFRDQLLSIIFAHEWECDVEVETLTAALG